MSRQELNRLTGLARGKKNSRSYRIDRFELGSGAAMAAAGIVREIDGLDGILNETSCILCTMSDSAEIFITLYSFGNVISDWLLVSVLTDDEMTKILVVINVSHGLTMN